MHLLTCHDTFQSYITGALLLGIKEPLELKVECPQMIYLLAVLCVQSQRAVTFIPPSLDQLSQGLRVGVKVGHTFSCTLIRTYTPYTPSLCPHMHTYTHTITLIHVPPPHPHYPHCHTTHTHPHTPSHTLHTYTLTNFMHVYTHRGEWF